MSPIWRNNGTSNSNNKARNCDSIFLSILPYSSSSLYSKNFPKVAFIYYLKFLTLQFLLNPFHSTFFIFPPTGHKINCSLNHHSPDIARSEIFNYHFLKSKEHSKQLILFLFIEQFLHFNSRKPHALQPAFLSAPFLPLMFSLYPHLTFKSCSAPEFNL